LIRLQVPPRTIRVAAGCLLIKSTIGPPPSRPKECVVAAPPPSNGPATRGRLDMIRLHVSPPDYLDLGRPDSTNWIGAAARWLTCQVTICRIPIGHETGRLPEPHPGNYAIVRWGLMGFDVSVVLIL